MLWRYQGDEQRLVRDAGRADPGTADDRASERLPRPVDERKAGIAERARKIAGDQDRLGAKVIEQGSRGRCYDGGRAQDRGKHQTGGGRRETAELVQVDDLEREDQPIAEEVDRIPRLQEQDQSGQVRLPTLEKMRGGPSHPHAAVTRGQPVLARLEDWACSSTATGRLATSKRARVEIMGVPPILLVRSFTC